ncbi:MAG: ubiquinone/menaquinone biosynthesis C-methylase UbiE [Planctomycetota bacterium]|jgi:ubiquinone/menaquinone biosynthesis C-methylase UbiE
MSDHYWSKFWVEHGSASADAHPQAQVFRTLHREPIEQAKWEDTLAHISTSLAPGEQDRLLDLCGGNGLIAGALAKQCKDVVVVDISDGLLAHAGDRGANVRCLQGDMRAVEFEDGSFERVLCYAALQYLTLDEAVALFERVYRWLTPGGSFFVGDIPDAGRQWEFFNSPERRSGYFSKLQVGEPIVGTWFDRQWVSHLAAHAGFTGVEAVDQPESQIYSWFRFDLSCTK